MHKNIQSRSACRSPKLGTTQVPINRPMNKPIAGFSKEQVTATCNEAESQVWCCEKGAKHKKDRLHDSISINVKNKKS